MQMRNPVKHPTRNRFVGRNDPAEPDSYTHFAGTMAHRRLTARMYLTDPTIRHTRTVVEDRTRGTTTPPMLVMMLASRCAVRPSAPVMQTSVLGIVA